MPGAAGSGGPRTPSAPAPTSGPGALSKRTDGGPAQKLRDLPDAQYGEAATYRDLQQSAPLAQSPSQGKPSGQSRGGAGRSGPPFSAPTAYPDQPVTAGLGAAVAPNPLDQQMDQQDLDQLRKYLPALMEAASRPDATQSFRNYVRLLRAKVG